DVSARVRKEVLHAQLVDRVERSRRNGTTGGFPESNRRGRAGSRQGALNRCDRRKANMYSSAGNREVDLSKRVVPNADDDVDDGVEGAPDPIPNVRSGGGDPAAEPREER